MSPIRRLTITDVTVGLVVWAYARHYWRQVRIVAKARTRVTVAYHLSQSGRLVRQDLHVWNLRIERPSGRYTGVLSVPPPATEFGYAAEKGGLSKSSNARDAGPASARGPAHLSAAGEKR